MHYRLIRGKSAHDVYSVCVHVRERKKAPKKRGGKSHYCIMRIISLRRYINGEWGERQLRALLTDDNTIAEKNQPSYITYYRISWKQTKYKPCRMCIRVQMDIHIFSPEMFISNPL